MANLPVIDFAPMLSDDPKGRSRLASELRAACIANGFFYATGTGVSPEAAADAIAAAKEFFTLPEAVKLTISQARSPHGRGYESMSNQRLEPGAEADLKEGFIMGVDLPADDPRVVAGWPQYGWNLWPEGMDAWRARVEAYHAAMIECAGVVMRALALSLDVEETYFDDFRREGVATLRMLHYPPQPKDASAAARGAGAHSDWGGVTILLQDEVGGLQVKNGEDDWIDAPPIPGTFVVNLADFMPRWTNGLYRSTVHRVINRSGRERYSLPFFFDGRGDYVSETIPTCIRPGETPRFAPLSVNQHLAEMYAATRAA
ncbi:isopenicillin N synthase family oxygenase [Chelatococcus sambhunathii]|uniref:2-oxoglutarate-dependent ethylene/succinate-forming enzyme n=1 Tax=Chelatococcus sambhunathii TaxID=363953 RepID=A0ABU1DD60_9HYPH|nr:2-oxoglutarate and iron-dependent oxygenase domain-containing protein [Chelatococcus sambhunathii]MDR4306006.1 isopenicillin N synthase family oxygenase [Chelatococcus sambhunathii]